MTYSEERRRFQRVRVNLIGRYMLPDQREFACQVREMSPGGASMIAPEAAPEGSRVIAYLDHVGRIEGRITRAFHGGFAMTIDAGRRKRDKLASQLTWLANRDSLGLPEDRRHDRYVPDDTQSEIRLPDGRVFPCDVIDMSLSGAAVSCLIRPEIGTIVEVGPETGKVVRHFDGGFAIEFSNAHRNILVG
ncbi:MAG: PilZ domain-containing protein [Pseudomonadota bacterium]